MLKARRQLVYGEHLFTALPFFFPCGFIEKVKLLCFSDSTETLSLKIQLDYSGQTMKRNQNISAFSERAPKSFRGFTIIA